MAIFKCKMCGGALEITEGLSVATCEYCGMQQTLPKLNDEKRANLYDRANHFRRNNEFDKAMGLYEQILSEDQTDAETYWSLVLCRYGIEYVEDPATKKRIPTVNRAQYSSIFADEDYISALRYADEEQKVIYEREAASIDEIQKRILAISNQEEPFDIFICYKETDNNGDRTPDSVRAQEIYKALTEEGYKVFFSRITLEDKLGSAYEPYIFAALNSAKVMLIVGTKPEYFSAVWVKNEWSRYLALIKNGKKKTIIPIYFDMSPYDLPEELSYIQAQDLSKIGFMQDLIHGIQKLIPLKVNIASASATTENQLVDSMLNKAFGFIESGDFKSAEVCLDTVYAYDANNPMYSVGRLLIETDCRTIEQLSELKNSIVDSDFYKGALASAEDDLKEMLITHGNHTLLNQALTIVEGKPILSEFKKAFSLLNLIQPGNDSDFFATVEDLKKKVEKSVAELEEKEQKEEKDALIRKEKRRKSLNAIKITFVVLVSLAILAGIVLSLMNFVIIPKKQYSDAIEAYEKKDYNRALATFIQLGDYEDSEQRIYQIEREQMSDCKVGDLIKYGKYFSGTKKFTDQYASVEWIVLYRDSEKALLLSKKSLDAMPYDTGNSAVTWTSSTLSKWLVKDFYEQAFSSKEKEYLRKDDTADRLVFILSSGDIKNYLTTEELRIAQPTDYAASKAQESGTDIQSTWWIATNAKTKERKFMDGNGNELNTVKNQLRGVRPAIWIDLNLTEEQKNKYEEVIRQKEEEAKQTAYNEALDHFNNGRYDDAISGFAAINDYKDASQMIATVRLAAGDACMVHGDLSSYERAIHYYTLLINGGENGHIDLASVAEKIKEAKYQYCLPFIDYPTDTTKSYMKELSEASYKDARALEKKMLAWKAEVTITKGMSFGIQSSVDFAAALRGGDGGSTKIKFVISYNGTTDSFSDEKLYSVSQTVSCNLSGLGDFTKNYYTVKVYDGNGNLIGQASGRPNK